MADKLFPFAIGDRIKTFLEKVQGPNGVEIDAGAKAQAQSDALAYAALVEELETGAGDDSVQAHAAAVGGDSAEARGVSIGDATGVDLVGTGSARLGDGNDTLQGAATARVTGDGAALRADANGVIVDRGSLLNTGRGDDTVAGTANATNTGAAGPGSVVVADGIENAGRLVTGSGADTVAGRGVATTEGATAIAGGLDNGVGASIGGQPVSPVLSTGSGSDHVSGAARASAIGQDAISDGIENAGTIDTGAGRDTVKAEAVSVAEGGRAIADGIDNRNDVFLGNGNDTVIANAAATGNGSLTIAEGIESRGLFDAGSGNDSFDLAARAKATAGVDADNLTQAAGLQTEQVTSGDFLLGDGDDTVVGRGAANSDGLENKATLAFGITQVTGDESNAGNAGLLDTSADVITTDNDTLKGEASAVGENDVGAFGVLMTNAKTGEGMDTVIGVAHADGKDIAQASGVAIGVSNNVPGEDSVLPDEAGTLRTGAGEDTIDGKAHATTDSGNENLLFNDVDAVLVDLDSTLETGAGKDTITGQASAIDNGLGGLTNEDVLSAVVADGVENRGTLNTGAGADVIMGSGKTSSNQAFSVAGGIDNGLGSIQNGIFAEAILDTGDGADKLIGTGESTAVGANAFAGGIENFGTIRTGDDADILQARARSLVTGGESDDEETPGALSTADGIDNRGVLNTGSGDDVLDARVSATADGGNAIAIGIRNESGGTMNTGSGADTLAGVASATGTEDVGAFGTLFLDASTGAGSDVIRGGATANGVGSTDARGVSVGLSDIDDDTLQNPDEEEGFLPAEVGHMFTGAGDDVIRGSAHVTAEAGDGQDIFFAGANGIVVDGGTEAQLFKLLAENPGSSVEDILDQLDVSSLETGDGNDRLIANVTLNVTGGLQGGDPSGEGDPDLEVIADGIENAGTIDLGAGNDFVSSTVNLVSRGGAKGLADALDNSSVGVITGLGLETNDLTLFDMGDGDDRFESQVSATVFGDFAAADGMGNRGTFKAGAGDDFFDLNATAVFQRDVANPGDQEEGIADGWENRKDVFLGEGNDTVIANASATGNGILTIAEGIESREFFDTGSGNDTLDLTAKAATTAGALNGNLTQAAGLQTEQIDAGTFLLGDGDDTVIGRGVANSDGIVPVADHPGDALQLTTLAFGITQVTGDASNADEAGLLDTSSDVVTTDNDTLEGHASATGEFDVEAFGVLFTNAMTGEGRDKVGGFAEATGANFAQANGVSVGVSNNVPLRPDEASVLPNEAGMLLTGAGDDIVEGEAHAATTSAGGQLFSDADAVLVDIGSTLDTGAGIDRITGDAVASDNGVGGGLLSAVVADGFENRGTVDTGDGDDVIMGTGATSANEAFSVAGGIDNGLGSNQAQIPVNPTLDTGEGADRLIGSATSEAVGDDAFAGAIENFGTIRTGADGDTLMAHATSKLTSGGSDDLSNADGLDNRGTVRTGSGDDVLHADVDATAFGGDADAIGIRNDLGLGGVAADNLIDLGSGSDTMVGDALAVATEGVATAVGISGGTIETGSGADTVRGIADAHSDDARAVGVFLAEGNSLSTGNGNDFVSGVASATGANAEAFGIAGGGTIDTGNGKDTVYASSFGEGVLVCTGNGKDTVTGFGEATVDGGNGKDRLVFEFDFFGQGGDAVETADGVDFTLDGTTLVSRDFEEFEINGTLFNHGDVLLA